MIAKKVPLRKCTGCNEMKPKKELVRVVLNKEGIISLDLTGRQAGRGAYVCRNVECFKQARKIRGFERAFKRKFPDELYEQMESELLKDG